MCDRTETKMVCSICGKKMSEACPEYPCEKAKKEGKGVVGSCGKTRVAVSILQSQCAECLVKQR